MSVLTKRAGAGMRLTIEQVEPSEPYLAAVGPAPLRFIEPPAAASEAAFMAGRPKSASASALPKPAEATPAAGAAPALSAPKPAPSASAETHSAGQPPGPDLGQPSIIPDEMRPRVRPEEFLPFFQPPGTTVNLPGGNITPPPSTATYKQE